MPVRVAYLGDRQRPVEQVTLNDQCDDAIEGRCTMVTNFEVGLTMRDCTKTTSLHNLCAMPGHQNLASRRVLHGLIDGQVDYPISRASQNR